MCSVGVWRCCDTLSPEVQTGQQGRYKSTKDDNNSKEQQRVRCKLFVLVPVGKILSSLRSSGNHHKCFVFRYRSLSKHKYTVREIECNNIAALFVNKNSNITLDLTVDGSHGSLLNRSSCVFLIHTSVPTCILLTDQMK